MTRVRILLADDHTLVAEAFRNLLEPQYEVIALVKDGRALLEAARQLKPDIAIVDIGMPLLNGLDAGRQLKQLLPKVKIVFLTMNEDPDIASEACRCGASGYILKTSAAAELLKAVREVVRGNSYISPGIAERLRPGSERPGKHLTARQREILQLLAEGRPMKEVADILQITPRTVAFHKYRIMETFNLKSSADLIRFVVRQGIVQ